VDCKKALANSNNDLNAALDWLREHGAAKVSSKVGDREAKEGLVGLTISNDHKSASLVQVSSETDFAGRSEAFVHLVSFCADAALQKKDINGAVQASDLLSATRDSKTVQEAMDEAKVAIRENLQLGNILSLSAQDNGVLVGYVHGRVLPSNAGTAAAIVDLSPDDDGKKSVGQDLLLETGKKLAMHIVAAKPQYLNPESVPTDILEGEKNILKKQLEDSKKPPEIFEKIVSGKIRKFYETVCLTEQAHMIEEDNPKISKNLKDLGIKLNRFEILSIN
jgi:elongation factor Ts